MSGFEWIERDKLFCFTNREQISVAGPEKSRINQALSVLLPEVLTVDIVCVSVGNVMPCREYPLGNVLQCLMDNLG